jgi:uncharacterized membrane protein
MLIVVPFYITYQIVRVLFFYIDGLSQPVIRAWLGYRISGVGFILTLILLYGLGLIATNVFGRSLLRWFEALLLRTPLVKSVYSAAKQVIETVSLPGKDKFKKVVLIEYPRKGIFAIGFVTGSTPSLGGRPLLNVFIPSPPNPTTGNIVFVPEGEVMNADLSIEEAIKMIVSGGLVTPKGIDRESPLP